MSGGAIVARQNRYMRTFQSAGATSEETAKTLKELGVVPIGIFRRLEKLGVFVRLDDNRYYMNEQMASNFVSRRSKYARLVLGVFGIALAIWYLVSLSL